MWFINCDKYNMLIIREGVCEVYGDSLFYFTTYINLKLF